MPISLCLRSPEEGVNELVIVIDGEQQIIPLSSDQVSFLSVQFVLAQARERDRLARAVAKAANA